MIHYTLSCEKAHSFEGWFRSSEDFDAQVARKLVSCPVCQSVEIGKGLMAPSVATARVREERKTMVMESAHREAMAKLRAMVAEIRAGTEDVGERFAEEARKIHYGEADARGIIGQTTPAEANALLEEGIEIAPLPILPEDTN